MSTYQVKLDNSKAWVDFAPQTEEAEILQNVRTILATHIGIVPLFRDFGTSLDALDMPTPIAQQMFKAAVIDAIEEFEPRATVKSVSFAGGNVVDGVLTPVVTVTIGNDEEEEEEEN